VYFVLYVFVLYFVLYFLLCEPTQPHDQIMTCSAGLYMTRLRVMDQTQLTGSVSRVDSTHRRCESS
jgi:hypothetical protein